MDESGWISELDAEPDGLLAAKLIEQVAGGASVIMVARSETRAERLHKAVLGLAPDFCRLFLLPAWDCLPFDRASPSRPVMGARMEVQHRLDQHRSAATTGNGALLIASVDAAMQLLPPPSAWQEIALTTGQPLDPDTLERDLERLGYALEDRVDAPGEAAVRGGVIDVFAPTDSLPSRIEHDEGRITEIRQFDPVTQRSREPLETLRLGPASELVLSDQAQEKHAAGIEHALPAFYTGLVSPFELMPDAVLALDTDVEDLRRQHLADVADAYEAAKALAGTTRESPVPGLYLDDQRWAKIRRSRRVIELAPASDTVAGALPRFPTAAAAAEFVRRSLQEGLRVGLAGPPRPRRALLRALRAEPDPVAGWLALRDLAPGALAVMEGSLEAGLVEPRIAAVIAPADFLGARGLPGEANTAPVTFETTLAPGNAVIHVDHGLGTLRDLETIESEAIKADYFRLAYAGDASLLVRSDEADRVWRYGADADGLTLDRLNTDGWAKRRAGIEQDLKETAQRLVTLAREREATMAPAMTARGGAYARLVARFPFTPTPAQAEAIAAVEADLASGRPMDRLVCGDVGYGKTEVALRAAAIAALSGWQVALVAPTTVLARQHVQTFTRRFAGLGVRIAGLSRLSSPAEERATRAGLADGSIGIAIGTQALASKNVRFAKLGLLIIDEEQRFGVKQKNALRGLRSGLHTLTMTATPIPRTLQSALAGLQELSVIATPPVRRQPVRDFRLPFDPIIVGQALEREKRRGGQSFVVCPRVADIEPMRARLRQAAPELELIEAHADMTPQELDEAMIRLADGGADVLLATNIIEAGLDVPRANTILIWRPDRFGLTQLHQLRGRVGRGRARGVVYLLTDPEVKLTAAAERRLEALEGHDRLGAGFAISARDLDLRGAGDLLGEDQAGHVKLIGLDLYQHLLRRAIAVARGEPPPEEWTPELKLDLPAYLPSDYVGDDQSRVELYDRLARALRTEDTEAIRALEDEIEDRFGQLPDPVRNLMAMARLRAACRQLDIAKLDVGPVAAAATLRDGAGADPGPPVERRGERLVLPRESCDPLGRLAAAEDLLERIEEVRSGSPSRKPG